MLLFVLIKVFNAFFKHLAMCIYYGPILRVRRARADDDDDMYI